MNIHYAIQLINQADDAGCFVDVNEETGEIIIHTVCKYDDNDDIVYMYEDEEDTEPEHYSMIVGGQEE